jgi:hypothetical protein
MRFVNMVYLLLPHTQTIALILLNGLDIEKASSLLLKINASPLLPPSTEIDQMVAAHGRHHLYAAAISQLALGPSEKKGGGYEDEKADGSLDPGVGCHVEHGRPIGGSLSNFGKDRLRHYKRDSVHRICGAGPGRPPHFLLCLYDSGLGSHLHP